MIIKLKTRNRPSFKQLLEYISNKDKMRLPKQRSQSFIITHNIKGNNIQKWVEQFKNNETYRKHKRSDSVYLTHEILSWHNEEIITPEKMEAMTREYLKLRNPNGMYIAIPHFDKGHYHVHICASGIEYKTGKSMRLPKANLAKLKKEVQEFQQQQFPELSKSIVQHGKKQKGIILTDEEYQIKQRTGRMTDKEQVLELLNTCYKQALSEVDFFKRIKIKGLTTYMRNNKLTGVVHKNRKHRLARLGFTEEKLLELNKTIARENELNTIRKKANEKSINR